MIAEWTMVPLRPPPTPPGARKEGGTVPTQVRVTHLQSLNYRIVKELRDVRDVTGSLVARAALANRREASAPETVVGRHSSRHPLRGSPQGSDPMEAAPPEGRPSTGLVRVSTIKPQSVRHSLGVLIQQAVGPATSRHGHRPSPLGQEWSLAARVVAFARRGCPGRRIARVRRSAQNAVLSTRTRRHTVDRTPLIFNPLCRSNRQILGLVQNLGFLGNSTYRLRALTGKVLGGCRLQPLQRRTKRVYPSISSQCGCDWPVSSSAGVFPTRSGRSLRSSRRWFRKNCSSAK